MNGISKWDKVFLIVFPIIAYFGLVWLLFYVQTWSVLETWLAALVGWILIIVKALKD